MTEPLPNLNAIAEAADAQKQMFSSQYVLLHVAMTEAGVHWLSPCVLDERRWFKGIGQYLAERIWVDGAAADFFNQEGTAKNGTLWFSTNSAELACLAIHERLARFPLLDRTGKPRQSGAFDLGQFATIGYFDQADQIFRTYWPHTTRPFHTLMQPRQFVEQTMAKGRSLRT